MRGLRVPVGVTSNGGAALINADENDQQVISISLGSSENENAFQQDITLGQEPIFGINDPNIRAKIEIRLIQLFDEFKLRKRFELKPNTIEWNEDSSNQELELTFKYVNLESDEEQFFRRSFTSSS